MFVKGMKYEIRSVARIVLPMLIVFLCAAMIMSAGFILDGRVLGFTEKAEEGNAVLAALFTIAEVLIGIGLFVLMIAINIAVYVLIIYRFYASFFTDEGYLTFTLPITIDCHLMIKIASMFFWNLVSVVVTALGGLIILGGVAIGYTEEFKVIFSEFPEVFEMLWMSLRQSVDYLGAQIVIGGLALLVTTIFQSLLIYFSIALGCMLFKKHRLLGGILSIFVVNGVYSTVTSIGSYILTYFSIMSEIAFLVMMGFTIVLTVVGIIAMYMGMRHILQKKLNLD
jgi:hypothetical protein